MIVLLDKLQKPAADCAKQHCKTYYHPSVLKPVRIATSEYWVRPGVKSCCLYWNCLYLMKKYADSCVLYR